MAEEQRQDSEISGTIAMAKTEDDDDAGISQVEEATRDEPVPVVKIDSYRDSHHINLTWRSWMVVLCVSPPPPKKEKKTALINFEKTALPALRKTRSLMSTERS
jgi:hypothetical protein